MSKNRTVGTRGEHDVARLLSVFAERAGFPHRWRRIESGRRPGSDIEAFDPAREAADPETRYVVWEPHIEVRRRRTWDRSGWARAQTEKYGTRWVLWMRPRDARVAGAYGEVRMPAELVAELIPHEDERKALWALGSKKVDGWPMIDMSEVVAGPLLVKRAHHHHRIKRTLYWRDR